MTAYAAPIDDMSFVLNEVVGLRELAALPGYEEATPDLVQAILEEAGKLAEEVLAPLNHSGDQQGAVYENGVVRTPEGFAAAYGKFVEGGWNALPFDPEYGGQGLPWAVAMAVQELWNAANMSFGLCPLLTQGTVELLQAHGSPAQRKTYLPKLISGEWTGTMNLTEPQAGSDVGALRTRAVRNGDHYLISGQKIYITWGEHDCAENIIHMVLARTPDAPEGTRGISLFIVPKFLPNADGSPGQRNDLRCVSIEHKLGIHGSPTAVMAYGDNEGAVGYLVGEENRGMACMFTMMNNARLAVGVQGIAIGERAYQQAVGYARERVQSRALASPAPESVPIIQHADVRRMLMTMRASVEASRALGLFIAAALDRAKHHPDEAERARNDAFVQVLTPVAKAWSTDLGCETASLGVQVHGGMGFIEETGAAQHYRDARILPIYEGTNGIQAMDLLTRKLLRDQGVAAGLVMMTAREGLSKIQRGGGEAATAAEAALEALSELDRATDWLLENGAQSPDQAAAGAGPYLRLFGTVTGGWLLAESAAAAARALANGSTTQASPQGTIGSDFLRAKIVTAQFYADNLLPQAGALAKAVSGGGKSTLALDEALF